MHSVSKYHCAKVILVPKKFSRCWISKYFCAILLPQCADNLWKNKLKYTLSVGSIFAFMWYSSNLHAYSLK